MALLRQAEHCGNFEPARLPFLSRSQKLRVLLEQRLKNVSLLWLGPLNLLSNLLTLSFQQVGWSPIQCSCPALVPMEISTLVGRNLCPRFRAAGCSPHSLTKCVCVHACARLEIGMSLVHDALSWSGSSWLPQAGGSVSFMPASQGYLLVFCHICFWPIRPPTLKRQLLGLLDIRGYFPRFMENGLWGKFTLVQNF